MKKVVLVSVSMIAMLVTFTLTVVVPETITKFNQPSIDALLLLVPDLNTEPALIQAWKNMAAVEGIHLDIQTDNEFLLPIHQQHINYQGIIIPDTIHNRMSRVLAKQLKSYVQHGGQLLLVYDAGTQSPLGRAYKDGSLFSDMLHFNYGVLGKPHESGIVVDPVGQSNAILRQIGIPPGKCMVDEDSKTLVPNEPFCAISSYVYGPLGYQHFKTKPIKNDISLLLTTLDHQYIAGVRPFGRGQVLFVNLPLTYLYLNTDAMPMQVFLHYFAFDILKLPSLSMVPNGVGGIILNLHVESKDALTAFPILKKIGLFKQGPYSIDFTAGPDVDTPGDKKGYDLLHNLESKYWVKYLAEIGHSIGSDGGWMHNYFGLHVSDDNQKEFQPYIAMNNAAIEQSLGKKILEFVPSMGNQPSWITQYLEQQGFVGYYTTSNIGASPMINVRNGVFDGPGIWSFPCLPLGQFASIRDFGFANLPEDAVRNWFLESSQFVALEHTSRLIYFHPPDILYFDQYLESLKSWLSLTKTLINEGRFHWYSMVDLADFLNARKGVYWKVENTKLAQIITASHIKTLAHQTWLIAKERCSRPKITVGDGTIREDGQHWVVVAGNIKIIQFQCEIAG